MGEKNRKKNKDRKIDLINYVIISYTNTLSSTAKKNYESQNNIVENYQELTN